MSGPNTDDSEYPIDLKLKAAEICLLNMTIYADQLLEVVESALQSESLQSDYLKSLRTVAPHLDGDSFHCFASNLSELRVDYSKGAAKAACLVFVHAGCEAALMKVAEICASQPTLWYDIIGKNRCR